MNDKYFELEGYKEAMKEIKASMKAKQRKAKKEASKNTGAMVGKAGSQLVTICQFNSDTLYY